MARTKILGKLISAFLVSIFLGCGLFQCLGAVRPFVFSKAQNNTRTDLDQMNIEQIASLERYDGRDFGFVPSVKDQGDSNICWAYACTNMAEVSILRSNLDPNTTKDNLSFSPEALAQSVYLRGKDPLNNVTGWQCSGNWYSSPGNYLYGADVLSQWCAPVNYGESGDYYEKCAYRMTDSVEYNFTNATVDSVIPIAKRAIAEYGAIATSYLNGRDTLYYNPKNETTGTEHAIIIIGWDDTIDKNLFTPGNTTRNGGWIVKNSYQSNQYFYMSYDKLLFSFMALKFATNSEYQYNYFYDSAGTKVDSSGNGGNTLYSTKKAANVFQAKMGMENKSEYLKAVNVHFTSKNTTCKVHIYSNLTDISNPESGTLAGTGTAFFEYGGYRTIKLDQPVKLDKDSYFSVVVEVSGSSTKITCSKQISDSSYVCASDGSWSKINSGNTPRIKAYTALAENQTEPRQIDIANAELTLEYQNIDFSGEEYQPKVYLNYNGATLVENQDFVVRYENNVQVGKATVIIVGINNYCGERVECFTITALPKDETEQESPPPKAKFSPWKIALILSGVGIGVFIMSLVAIKKVKHRKKE